MSTPSSTYACIGCGILAPAHPVVAVMHATDVPDGVSMSAPNDRGFVATPCCAACHQDPAHRVRPIKAHFFASTDAAAAVFHAGSNAIGGRRG